MSIAKKASTALAALALVVATTSARAASAVEAFFAMLISFFITNPSFQTVQISQALSVDKT